nr:MAG TPA: hypothetical protein [Caudoviricetes sp.]
MSLLSYTDKFSSISSSRIDIMQSTGSTFAII